jgi:hypothetical protein
MAAPEIDLSPMAVALAVAGSLVSPQLAYYVGAYAIIFIGWFGGLLFGLYRRAPESTMPVWAYSVCTLIASVGATVPASEALAKYIPFAYTALLFPVAFAIPAMPDKWGDVGQWLLNKWEAARGVKQ